MLRSRFDSGLPLFNVCGVCRDALLDDAVNDIVLPAPAVQQNPPKAVAPTAVALNNPVAKSLTNAGLPAEVATRWASIIVADQRAQVTNASYE